MIHFVIHVVTPQEIEKLPTIIESLKCFPDARLHVFNQTRIPVEGSIVCENTKNCGFGWTLRFLRHVYGPMTSSDLAIKIDPDTEIYGNPLTGLDIPHGHVLGQFEMEGDCCGSVFYGGFQGYTRDAIEIMLERGPMFENETGPQDMIAQSIVNVFEIPFLQVPNIELWDSAQAPADNILVWHRERGFRSRNCK